MSLGQTQHAPLTRQTVIAKPPTPGIIIPKQGILLKILGGSALMASFFLPAIKAAETTFYPYSTGTILLRDLWLQALFPVIYLFGFSSALVALVGRFRKHGLPKIVLGIHLVITTLIILGSGAVIHLALLNPRHDFGIALLGPALLVWWPLFLQYLMTWLNGKRDFLWKLARTNWISSLVAIVFFSLSTFVTWYAPQRSVSLGLYLSLVSSIMLLFGNLRNEARETFQ